MSQIITANHAPPALLPNLGRAPRILIVGESILNSAYITARLQALLPAGTVVVQQTYAGSMSAMGLLCLATDVQSYITPGNLISNTSLTTWAVTSITVTANVASPTTGKTMTLLTAAGVSQQKVNGNLLANGGLTVPAGAPQLTYSIEFEPGTLTGFRLLVRNSTTAATVAQQDWNAAETAAHGTLPYRACLTVNSTDGVGYAAGDTLTVYIYLGPQEGYPAGTAYVADPTVNVGGLPTTHHPTSGTPEAAGTVGWAAPPKGQRRGLFDLVVLQFGVNDAGAASPTVGRFAHEATISACISGAAALAGRVLVCTPPPQALANLTAFDPGNDLYQNNGLYAAAKRAALRHGAALYDAVADFQAQVSGGAAVNTLMRDTFHPTDANSSSLGMGLYVSAIVAAATSLADRPARTLSPQPVARLGGQVAVGTWPWTAFVSGTGPLYDAHGMHAAYHATARVWALVSSTAGHQLTYSIKGTVIGLIYLNDASTGGTAAVSVDGQAAVSVTMNAAGLTNYHKASIVASGLADDTHTVTVTVTSGNVRVVGVVACS